MQLGKLGVWASTDVYSAGDAAQFAKDVESWGYSALWMPETFGRNPLVHSAWLLANTAKLIVATGIANIYARDAVATKSAQNTLAEQSGGRFLLGLGVSHAPLVEGGRGHTYGKPVATMRAYLEAMEKAPYMGPVSREKPLTILAALRPNMLALSAEKSDGAHPYNTTPQHTAEARAILGSGKLLCPEQMVMLETDPARARSAARKSLARYFRAPNYQNSLKRLGFTDDDFAAEGSDRVIDGLVAWGDEVAIRRRIQEHWDAGADHVCIQALDPSGDLKPDRKALALLAKA
jgi:probable F420-dependent oxidoreductase